MRFHDIILAIKVQIWHEGAFQDFLQILYRLVFQVYQYDDILKFDILMKFEPFITNRLFVALIAVSIWTNDISLYLKAYSQIPD